MVTGGKSGSDIAIPIYINKYINICMQLQLIQTIGIESREFNRNFQVKRISYDVDLAWLLATATHTYPKFRRKKCKHMHFASINEKFQMISILFVCLVVWLVVVYHLLSLLYVSFFYQLNHEKYSFLSIFKM